MVFVKKQSDLECSHCENVGEITYATFQRQQRKNSPKVWVKHLPPNLSESGLKNLFLTVGEPLCITSSQRNRNALVEFGSMKEVELAIRDLNGKPPYYLQVVMALSKSGDNQNRKAQDSEVKEEVFAKVIKTGKSSQDKGKADIDKEMEKTVKQVELQLKDIIEKLGYNPSIRMRQKVLDFKSESVCISKGRGFINMGSEDRFVGGLQKFVSSSKNSKAKDEMIFFCENCQSLTTKICGHCSLPFCSKVCLSSTEVKDHINCLQSCSNLASSVENDIVAATVSQPLFPTVAIKSGCNVVIASYFTMRTVYVRPFDEFWDTKLSRLCNEVAEEAIKGNQLIKSPNLHDLVIARYYEDLCFYRAQVYGLGENKILVFFVDFGNTQETLLEDLHVFPEHLKSLPGLAVRVHLKGVSDFSSADAVSYFNNLTVDGIPLILEFEKSTDEVFLIEKDSKASVNQTVFKLSLPSWKKEQSTFSKTDEIFYLDSIKKKTLEIGKSYNLKLSHFDDKEFLESEIFWMVDQEADEFLHANTEMFLRKKEYCELTKDFYLPRTNELCLAKENGEWHRCVNLENHKTTCCLFFIDDGHSSLIETVDIRKMVQDFTEMPALSICCILPDHPELKKKQCFHSEVIKYLTPLVGQTINSVKVLKLIGDAYYLSFPEFDALLKKKNERSVMKTFFGFL